MHQFAAVIDLCFSYNQYYMFALFKIINETMPDFQIIVVFWIYYSENNNTIDNFYLPYYIDLKLHLQIFNNTNYIINKIINTNTDNNNNANEKKKKKSGIHTLMELNTQWLWKYTK